MLFTYLKRGYREAEEYCEIVSHKPDYPHRVARSDLMEVLDLSKHRHYLKDLSNAYSVVVYVGVVLSS